MTGYQLLKFTAFGIVAQGRIQCAVPCCGIRALSMLHLDHIRNDGCRHRRRHSKAGGVRIYRWVLKHPSAARRRLQILCANHDRLKQVLGSIDRIVELEEQELEEAGITRDRR
jgi:hypothetical protein